MRTLAKLSLILIVGILTLPMVCRVKAQVAGDNVKNFFNSEMLGLSIQVNATAETRPGGTLTIWLLIMPQPETKVHVDSFRLDVYGFLNGTERVSIGNINDSNLPNETERDYNETFTVPDGISGVTFGEITLNYSVTYMIGRGFLVLPFPNAVSGFYMTQVGDALLESLQGQLKDLNGSYTQLKGDYSNLTNAYLQLNQTYLQLQQNYTSLQGSMGMLDSTRSVAVVLAITTIFFVITTVLMVMRRPKESW
jgi:hypothetical protein